MVTSIYGAAAIPAATNLMTNPQPASLTGISGTNGLTPLLVYDWSYVGETSTYLAIGATNQELRWNSGGASSFPAPATGVQYLRAAVRVRAPLGCTIDVLQLAVHYTDTTADLGPNLDADLVLPAREKAQKVLTAITTPNPAKTISYVQLRFSLSVAANVYLAGADLRRGSSATLLPVDSLVMGGLQPASGPAHTWAGVAHASASSRAGYSYVPQRGRGGVLVPTVTYYKVNRQNIVLDDITRYVNDCTVTYDAEAETWKGTANFVLNAPDVVRPFGAKTTMAANDLGEFIRPQVRIERPDGTVTDNSAGVFAILPPSESWTGNNDVWTCEGRDLLWILATDTLVNGYAIDKGRPLLDEVRKLIQQAGFAEQQISIPSNVGNTVAGETWGFEPGSSRLHAISTLLTTSGWLPPFPSMDGVISALPNRQLSQVEPSITFATGQGSLVLWPFTAEPDVEKVWNRITVWGNRSVKKKRRNSKKKNAGVTVDTNPWYQITVENNDQSHPFSIPRLGRVIAGPTIARENMQDLAAAEREARAELEKGGTLPVAAKLTTIINIRELNEVYLLNLADDTGSPIESGQGRYFCKGWTARLGPPWTMTSNLTRVIPIAELLS